MIRISYKVRSAVLIRAFKTQIFLHIALPIFTAKTSYYATICLHLTNFLIFNTDKLINYPYYNVDYNSCFYATLLLQSIHCKYRIAFVPTFFTGAYFCKKKSSLVYNNNT